MKNQNFYNALLDKVYKEPEFKAELIKSPLATIEKFVGKKYENTNGVKIVVEDQSNPDYVYLNIPTNRLDNGELTMEELEAIVGGGLGSWIKNTASSAVNHVTNWATSTYSAYNYYY